MGRVASLAGMDVIANEPVGARVEGLRVQDVGDAGVEQLRGLLARHGVLSFPDQDVDDAGFVAFLERFGELRFATGETPVEGHPDLNIVTNVGRTTTPKSSFHVDTSYLSRPPAYTSLRAVAIPSQGGQTEFTNQYRAFETLPGDLREKLAGRTVTHVVTGLELGPDDETEAEHPLFRRHPVSGRTAIYLSTPQRCVAVSGMDDDEARETVQALLDHSTREDNIYQHAWSPGDVVMWDNLCVMHRADHSGVVGDRTMHRGMVDSHPAA